VVAILKSNMAAMYLEIQYGGHVASLPMAPFDWPNSKT
jgi:hypothetical protein